jgi:hypothetical protein
MNRLAGPMKMIGNRFSPIVSLSFYGSEFSGPEAFSSSAELSLASAVRAISSRQFVTFFCSVFDIVRL